MANLNKFGGRKSQKAQSSLELLVTLAFGIIVLLPIVIIAFIQISASTSNLAVSEAQASSTKLASVAASVGAQGPPAKQLIIVDVPPDVQNIEVGNQNGGIGHAIIFVVNTNAGPSDVVAYSPVNVSGAMGSASSEGSYLINVSAQSSCPSSPQVPCVYITPS